MTRRRIYEKYIKRGLDILCSVLAILCFWWLFLIVAVLVRVKLGSPVLFTQDRPGKDGKIFRLYKFRSMTDKRDALYQAIYLILNVERYAYPIYSRNYGSELSDLIGKPKDYAMSELKRRITEALEQDDRITGVGNWSFETGRKTVLANFTVYTIYGEIKAAKEVEI